jgi:hypothetical protein
MDSDNAAISREPPLAGGEVDTAPWDVDPDWEWRLTGEDPG